MTKYREIIRLAQPELNLSQQKIALSCGVSKKTVSKVLKAANEKNVSWPLPASYTDAFLEGLLFPGKKEQADASKRRMPDYEYVRLPDLLLELEIARNEGTYKKIQARYANPVLLIIDEWFLLKPTETEQHDILEILHRRRKKSSTIFCSQYDPSGGYDQLGGDDSPLAEAILDKIKHDAYKINTVPTDSTNYKSMREVYDLDPALSA